jgi:hypothetical protein
VHQSFLLPDRVNDYIEANDPLWVTKTFAEVLARAHTASGNQQRGGRGRSGDAPEKALRDSSIRRGSDDPKHDRGPGARIVITMRFLAGVSEAIAFG